MLFINFHSQFQSEVSFVSSYSAHLADVKLFNVIPYAAFFHCVFKPHTRRFNGLMAAMITKFLRDVRIKPAWHIYWTGCEYGDRDPTYCARNSDRMNCYDSNYLSSCCATCQSKLDAALNSSIGCGYGDRASWCSTIESWQCYDSSATCCDKCHRLSVGPAGSYCSTSALY